MGMFRGIELNDELRTCILHTRLMCSDMGSNLYQLIECCKNHINYCFGAVDEGIIPPEAVENSLIHVITNSISLLSDIRDSLDIYVHVRLDSDGFPENWNDFSHLTEELLKTLIQCNNRDLRVLPEAIAEVEGVAEYWCSQKWLGGQSSIGVGLDEHANYVLVSLREQVMPMLKQLYQMIQEYQSFKMQFEMAAVYAPPDLMQSLPKLDSVNRDYPFIHSVHKQSAEESDPYIPSSPELIKASLNADEESATEDEVI